MIAQMNAHAETLRMVALRAITDARAAWRKADANSNEENLRAALRVCVLAARALRRASTEHPDEEQEMLDRATLLDETAVGLKRKLARLVESALEQ
jgi:hypothetical protein